MGENLKISENEILVLLAGKFIKKNKTNGLLYPTRTDWGYLAKVARYHRVIPFIYPQLAACPEITVPRDVLEDLKRSYLRIVQMNMLMTSELIAIYDILNARGIPAIPFKGPVLAQVLYSDIKSRHYSDLDILVHREDVCTVREILLHKGYRPEEVMTPSQESAFIKSAHHYRFTHRPSGFDVEVHWEISPRIYSFNLDLAKVWEHAKQVTLSGHEVRCLSPEDMCLILCEHGTRHYWKRLSWVCDVARLIELDEINWDRLFEEAAEIGSSRVLLLGVSLAHHLIGIDLPAGLSSQCARDPEVAMLTQKVADRFLCEKHEFADSSKAPFDPDIEEELFYLQARERFSDRFRYYLRRAITPGMEDWNYVSLPDFLAPLYPFVRIRRLIGKYKMEIWKWFGKQ